MSEKRTHTRHAVMCCIVCLVLMLSATAHACSCNQCHEQNGVTVTAPASPVLQLHGADGLRRITLADAFAFHGHECPGMTTAFLALNYGIGILFPDEPPRPDDLLILSRTSAGGIKDLIDMVMKGANPATRSWPPLGLGNGEDRFSFTLIRKSTSELLEVRLQPEMLPNEFFSLKQKQKTRPLSAAEQQQLHDSIKHMILEFPSYPAQKLFGEPQVQKIMLWGNVAPHEQDRHIWKQRQRAKQKSRG